jgi:ribosomal protein L37E
VSLEFLLMVKAMGAMDRSEKNRNPVMVVCRRCGPEITSFAGRVEWRLCRACQEEITKLREEGWT